MHLPTFSADLSQRTARLAAAGFGVVASFHLLLTLGAPWGRATLGGLNDGALPPELRVVSSISMAVFIGATVVVLGRAGHWGDRFSRAFGVATWALVIVLALGALANLASSSPWERFGWAPFTVLLTVATFIVARAPRLARRWRGGMKNLASTAYDVVIVGGGAAGLSAALVLGRARRRVAVVDAGSPRNAPAAHMQGFLSRDGMPPAELLAIGRAEVGGYGVELIEDAVVGIDAGFVVRLGGGDVLRARRVLVATGVRDELPDIPGVRERWGRDLLHCPYCHGWEVRDQPLGVLGTRPDAVQHALLVRQWSDDVVFFAHTLDLDTDAIRRLAARAVPVVPGAVARLVVEADRLTGVELVDGRVIARSAVFIRPVNVPHADGLLAGLGCDLDAAGFPVVDATGRTSIADVWAAGNVVDPRLQVITSAGAGSAAAIAINADLVQEDVELAVDGRR